MRIFSSLCLSILLVAAFGTLIRASTPAEVVPVEVAQSGGANIEARAFRQKGSVRLVCDIDYASGGHSMLQALRIILKDADGKALLKEVRRPPRREREPNGKLDDTVTLRATFVIDPFSVEQITVGWD